MIKEIRYYYCEECKLIYPEKKKAYECEEWCKENKMCNIGITKFALKGGKDEKSKIVH